MQSVIKGESRHSFIKLMSRALKYPLQYYTASRSGRTIAHMVQFGDGRGQVVVVQDGEEIARVEWKPEPLEEPMPLVAQG